MQNIDIFATADNTVATVRDSANAKTLSAPTLVIGVAAEITLSLFAKADDLLPLPPSMLSGIVHWSFVFDDDFKASTEYKIVASEVTVSMASSDGATDPTTGAYIPTLFNISIPNMNSAALNAWLDDKASRSGLIGELVGYDSNGAFVFVLQIQGFTVRNRVTASGEIEPPADMPEYLTLDAARAMFLTDSNPMKPTLDVVSLEPGGNPDVDGHYLYYEKTTLRIGGTQLYEDIFFREDRKAFVRYNDDMQAWVIYKLPDIGAATAKFYFRWIKTGSNPGPISGVYDNASNPQSGYSAAVTVTPRYNIQAQTY